MKKIDIEKGSKRADARFRITVEETGPYLIYGQPPLAQQLYLCSPNNYLLSFTNPPS